MSGSVLAAEVEGLTVLLLVTMDRECVSLLPRVCEVLADSQRSLPDDTSLEKLLDWFTGLTEAGGSLLESCPCLMEFISAVIDNKDSDPGVLSFTLKLTGLIAAAEDSFQTLQDRSVLDRAFSVQQWQDSGLWEDPCVRIGWIQGLKSSLQHTKALSFFIQSDFIKTLLKLQTDTSLFVASAANQMLAHILLFFQTCVQKKEEKVNGSRNSLDIGSGGPAAEYTAAVKVISENLKESLVPKDSAQLHRSLQTLKLLALLLAQAGSPLRDELIQAVGGSLEEVVTADCSQLTAPLMDVILAAYSSKPGGQISDQHVSRLLSSMLETSRPPVLIQAAAALLRSGHHDSSHTPQAVKILLLPLEMLTGQTLLCKTSSDDLHVSMAQQLKSKPSCVSMICSCLTNTPKIVVLTPDLLPCPPASVTSTVLSVLRLCSGASSGCNEVCRNVIGSRKVQKCALDALTALSSSAGSQENTSDVLAVLTQYLQSPGSDPTVLHKSFQALMKWTSTDLSVISDQIRSDLADVLKKRVCDVRWEVRDSAVEFLGHVADRRVLKSGNEASSVSGALLGGCCTISLLREALQDTESYVRASAVSALAKTLTRSWQQGAAPTQEETEIVTRLLEILSQDTEGFARRAVVRFFIVWFSASSSSSASSSLLMQSVRSVLSQGSADLDWEVKVHTLELAELLMDKSFKGQRGYRKYTTTNHALSHPYGVVSGLTHKLHAHTEGAESNSGGALKSLVELGVVSALLSGLVDCDRPVGLKACRLLITLRETVCPEDVTMATTAEVSCELPVWGWGQEIRKILLMKNGDFTRKEGGTEEERRGTVGATVSVCGVRTEEERCGTVGATVSVCGVLRSLSLEDRLDLLTRSSDHVHNSPLSLLQDILTARTAHTRTDTQAGQEVIVDCY
ncbi:BRCA1-associated ATM activator 1 [Xyrichtys novacula]|uniref:BRCA1-associated ATM activator 1 n=1 Tax=Xyrichtys novacula TaxID=13765 RepID=A0AAV1EYW7_XYRNO|nr:BRCA1-associated ATM activator 1 [Xyrichtys novacula]